MYYDADKSKHGLESHAVQQWAREGNKRTQTWSAGYPMRLLPLPIPVHSKKSAVTLWSKWMAELSSWVGWLDLDTNTNVWQSERQNNRAEPVLPANLVGISQ